MRRFVPLAVAGFAVVVVLHASATTKPALRPPFLTQAKPVYGVEIPGDDKTWTYNGDYVLAIFDYDRINGNPAIKSMPYTVCTVAGTAKKCVKRVWRGRPDIWMVRVLGPSGAGRFFEFRWTALGKQRGTARVWIYE